MEQIRPNSRTPLSSLTLDQARQSGQKPTMDQVGKAFESVFMQSMMKSMRDAQIEGGLLENEHSKPFQSMLDGLYSEMAVKRTNLGLAEAIKRQFAAQTVSNLGAASETRQNVLNASRSTAGSAGLPLGGGVASSTGDRALPISDLAGSLAAQQSASVRSSRPAGNHFAIPGAPIAPKF